MLGKGKKTLFFASLLILALIFPSIPIVNGIPTYEDFTTYTEVDPNNHIEKTSTHVDFQPYRNEKAYLYDDKGVGYFTDFEHLLDVKIVSGELSSWGSFWMLANEIGSQDQINAGADSDHIFMYQYSANEFNIAEWYDGMQYTNGFEGLSLGKTYYIIIKVLETSFTCEVYGDSVRTDLLYTLSLTLHKTYSLQYIYVANTIDTGNSYNADIDIENLDLEALLMVSFYNNSGGILKVNGTTISNGTSKGYAPNEVIELSGLPLNSSYRFQNFTWDSNYNETNPYNLTVTSDLTVWCYFHKPSSFNVGFALGFVLMLMVGLILALTLSSTKRK